MFFGKKTARRVLRPAASEKRVGSVWVNKKGEKWRVVRGARAKKWKKETKASKLNLRTEKKGHIVVRAKRGTGKKWKKLDRSSIKGRKSPSVSASKYKVGTRKRGLDGNMWVIKMAARKGIKYRKWVRAKAS